MLNSFFNHTYFSFKALLASTIYPCLLFSYLIYILICFLIYPLIAFVLFLKYQYIKSKDLKLLKEAFIKYNIKEFSLSSERDKIKITSINNSEISYLTLRTKAFKAPQFLLFTIREKIANYSTNKEAHNAFLLNVDIKEKQFPLALYHILLQLKQIQAFSHFDLTLTIENNLPLITLTNSTLKNIACIWIDLCTNAFLVPKVIIKLEKSLDRYCKTQFRLRNQK